MMIDILRRFEVASKRVLTRCFLMYAALAAGVLAATLVAALANAPSSTYAGLTLVALLLSSLLTVYSVKRIIEVELAIVMYEMSRTSQPAAGATVEAPAAPAQQAAPAESAAARPVLAAQPPPRRRPAPPAASERRCPYCNRVLPFGDIHTICPYCGKRLR